MLARALDIFFCFLLKKLALLRANRLPSGRHTDFGCGLLSGLPSSGLPVSAVPDQGQRTIS